MKLKEEIKTIASPAEFRFKEKGSLFIARGIPSETESGFLSELTKIKKEYYDATHHCYALRLKDDSVKYSDDGEPSGTAGIRILNALEHFLLYDSGVVVIRYFGGTKLGTGPLGKAYFNAAEGVLNQIHTILKKPFAEVTVSASYDFMSSIHHFAAQYNAGVKNVIYSENVNFTIEIDPRLIDEFSGALINASNGRIEVINQNLIIYKGV